MSDATNLTAEQLEQLRAEAYAQRSPFIDPAAWRAVTETHFYPEWATAILGHPYQGPNRIERWELSLLALALAAEPDRPIPAAVAAAHLAWDEMAKKRAAEDAAKRQVERDAWHALRDRLPVPVTVGHNWTMGHYDGHVAGKDHIVVQADLHVGRLHRPAKEVLCATPSKKTSGSRNKDPLRGVDRDDDGEDRIPTCKQCLRISERIAKPAPDQLG